MADSESLIIQVMLCFRLPHSVRTCDRAAWMSGVDFPSTGITNENSIGDNITTRYAVPYTNIRSASATCSRSVSPSRSMGDAMDVLVVALVVLPCMASNAGPYMSYALAMSSVDTGQFDMDRHIDMAIRFGGCPSVLMSFMASSAL